MTLHFISYRQCMGIILLYYLSLLPSISLVSKLKENAGVFYVYLNFPYLALKFFLKLQCMAIMLSEDSAKVWPSFVVTWISRRSTLNGNYISNLDRFTKLKKSEVLVYERQSMLTSFSHICFMYSSVFWDIQQERGMSYVYMTICLR